jgi:hypothetical protein
VTIDKFPTKKRFSVDVTDFSVEPESQTLLTLNWSPDEVGGVRETVTLKSDQICQLKFIMVALGTKERMRPRKVTFSDPGVLGLEWRISPGIM